MLITEYFQKIDSEIETFPHHKHTRSGKIIEASIPALARVLDEVDKLIAQLE